MYYNSIMKQYLSLLFLTALLISCSKKNPQYNDPIPAHDNFTMESKSVNEKRVINVWLPDEYKSGDIPMPVMYMPDGGIKEDFPHIANTLAKLIQAKSIEPIILVGIENTQRRKDLTGPTEIEEDKEIAAVVGGAESFRAFIKEELMPEIDLRYRTTKEKGIIGESAAGLFVVETLMLEPDMFNFYIAMDPSIWWNDKGVVRTAKDNMKKLPSNKVRFWFAGSDVQKKEPFIAELSDLIELNYSNALIWKYSDEPNEKHSTIFRATKEKAITWIMNVDNNN